MNTSTRLLVLLICLGCVGFMAFGAGEQEAAKAEEYTVWIQKYFYDISNEMLTERFEQFGVENGVRVKVEVIPYPQAFPKWTAAIEAGVFPDVTFMGYQEVGPFVKQGVLLDVSDIYKKIQRVNGKFWPAFDQALTTDGKQYGIPLVANADVLYYRKDKLAEAGFGAAPDTWEDFRVAAKKVTDAKSGFYGAGLGSGLNNADAKFTLRALIWAHGGSLVDESGKKVVINSPGTIEAFEFMRALFLEDKSVPPGATNWSGAGNNNAWLSGQVAMIINVGSVTAKMRMDKHELLDKTGTAVVPKGPAGRFTDGRSGSWVVFKDAQDPETSKRMIEFVMDKDWYYKWNEASMPVNGPVYPHLIDAPFWADPLDKPLADSLGSAKYLGYPANFSAEAGEVFVSALLVGALDEVLVKKVPVEKAVADLQKQVEAVFAQ